MMLRFQRTLFLTVVGLFPCSLSSQTIFDVVRKGDIQLLQKLYTLKPDTINSINENGFTPLIIAVYRYQNETAKFLLEHGASVNVNSPEGPALLAAVYKNNTEMVEALIKHKANLDLTNEEGVTALMFATMNNNLKLVDLLLKHGANKTLLSKSGHSALSYAKMYNFTEVRQTLSK
jgi:uncharacterized protein